MRSTRLTDSVPIVYHPHPLRGLSEAIHLFLYCLLFEEVKKSINCFSLFLEFFCAKYRFYLPFSDKKNVFIQNVE